MPLFCPLPSPNDKTNTNGHFLNSPQSIIPTQMTIIVCARGQWRSSASSQQQRPINPAALKRREIQIVVYIWGYQIALSEARGSVVACCCLSHASGQNIKMTGGHDRTTRKSGKEKWMVGRGEKNIRRRVRVGRTVYATMNIRHWKIGGRRVRSVYEYNTVLFCIKE